MPKIVPPVVLSEDERRDLTVMSKSRSLDHRYVQRSAIILLWAEGKTLVETSAEVKMSLLACRKWRNRFAMHRLDGLKEEQRSGRPKTIPAETLAKIVEVTCSKPPKGYSNWSQRAIAAKCGVSQSTVAKVLRNTDLKPHKTEYWCGKPTDPEFETKLVDVIGLYLNPPENALVLCVDEKTQIQALDRLQPQLPMREGNPKRLTHTYKRHGTVSLIAALSVHSGKVDAKTIEGNNAQTFLAFLKHLYRKHTNKHLHIILDNHSVHKSKEVKEWLARRRKITLHYTPTYSSWLNQVEIWFSILSRDVLRGAVWTSKQQLVNELMAYVKTYSENRAKPFRWTYTGEPLRK